MIAGVETESKIAGTERDIYGSYTSTIRPALHYLSDIPFAPSE
jgi:hypothetical protein